ncbi:MAG: hypothetical protein KH117_11490 [Dysgonomonas sp.]|uniref:hypothetical protein n=1 Tax=Dysgonomonas sp. TaxID=1891233 RepID=UPI00257DA065|nr:hypothetical protein [Dysgonomonas sp.]MBS7121610.1 hypothetical protein [Dysgonomonas sp.]
MKKKHLFFLIALLIPVYYFYSCQSDIVSDSTDSKNNRKEVLAQARNWYENNKPGETIRLKSVSYEADIKATPNWEQAFRRQNKEYKVVETALKWSVKNNYVTHDCYDAYKRTGDKRYLISKTRMVILTDKKTNETCGFMMTLMPSKEYWDSSNFNPFKDITYLDKKTFSGKIGLFALDGKFIEGFIYKDGEQIGTMTIGNLPISSLKMSKLDNTLKSNFCVEWSCTTYDIYELRSYCYTDTYVDDEWGIGTEEVCQESYEFAGYEESCVSWPVPCN